MEKGGIERGPAGTQGTQEENGQKTKVRGVDEMALVTYTYYQNTYMGSASETDFNKGYPKAMAIMNRLTFSHIICVDDDYGQEIRGSFTEFTEEELDATRMGVCSLIDAVIAFAAAKTQALAGSGSIKAVSSGGESITYDVNKTIYDNALASKEAEDTLYRNALLDYMRPELYTVNPFFAGVR